MSKSATGEHGGLWRPAVLFLLFLLAGCSGERAEPAPHQPTVETVQMMNWILDPNADVIWDFAGYEVTAEGTRSLAPTTEEEWNRVRNSAATIAEFSNLLMMPGWTREGMVWTSSSQGMQMTAVQLIDAAERQDAGAVFDYGGQLFTHCVSCHDAYMVPKPSP